jgi:predicted phage terminase large subunit-like protein
MMNLPPSPQGAVSPEEAAQKILARRNARKALLHFTNFTFPAYVADPAHELIAVTLDRVVEGEIKKLMIFAPPQHGKSELVSVRLPAYWLGRHPNDPIIITSYGAALAEKKSRQARSVVQSQEFTQVFGKCATLDLPVELSQDSHAVQNWKLAYHRGEVLAAGVAGPITGNGARLAIIDDPFESWEHAQSQTIRDKIWEWYRNTFRTRVWEGGCIVLIMTRWHEDDLAGRLLAEQGDEWTVLRLPALAETQAERDENDKHLNLPPGQPDPLGREPGEPLCPRRFSKPALLALQKDVGTLGWQSEYQGCPRAAEGNRFKRQYFTIINAVPANIKRWVRYWDKATSTSADACFTAGALLGITEDKQVIIADMVHGRWSSGERRAVMRQTAETDRQQFGHVQIEIEQEPGSSGLDSVQDEIKILSGFAVHPDRPSGNKDVRLEPFAAQAEAGNVKLVQGAWNSAYIEEMCAIPNGKYRDQGDATSGAYNKAAGRGKASADWA